MSASCSGRIRPKKDEPIEVVVILAQDPLLEAGRPGVELVPAVVDLFAAGHHEDHVGPSLPDPRGDLHEQVEAADRLQAPRDERHDPRARPDRLAADLAGRRPRAVKLGVDPIKEDVDLGLKSRGERLLLPLGRRVAGIAVDQRHERGSVDTAWKERRRLGGRQVDAIGDVAMAVREVVFAIDDDRAIDDLAHEQRRRTRGRRERPPGRAAARAWPGSRRGPTGIARDNGRRSEARECRRYCDARPPAATDAVRAP